MSLVCEILPHRFPGAVQHLLSSPPVVWLQPHDAYCGQTNRVQSARIAVGQAGDAARGAVSASDAFIPFPDTVEVCAAAGVTAIIQTGGSIRDEDSAAVCDANNMALVATGVRHFKH